MNLPRDITLPDGSVRHNVGSDNLSSEDRTAMKNELLTQNMSAPKAFVDMDGVLADFDGYMRKHGLTANQVKSTPGAYAALELMLGAQEGVAALEEHGFEVWIASKPPTGQPHAYAEKVEWVLKHFAKLKRRIILTHDKGLLGCKQDMLIDDRPHKANCESFQGRLIVFGGSVHRNWDDIICDLPYLFEYLTG